ncbi:hypothetical protein [Streptomyces sp. NPDC055506]
MPARASGCAPAPQHTTPRPRGQVPRPGVGDEAGSSSVDRPDRATSIRSLEVYDRPFSADAGTVRLVNRNSGKVLAVSDASITGRGRHPGR